MSAPPHHPAGRGSRWRNAVIFLVVFAAVLAGAILYTAAQPKIYEGTALIRLLNPEPSTPANTTRGGGYNPYLPTFKLFESPALARNVAARLTADQLRQLLAPFETGAGTAPVTPVDVLARSCNLVPRQVSNTFLIQCRHPDPRLTATVANLFAEQMAAAGENAGAPAKTQVLERARPAAEGDYVSPSLPLHFALGLLLATAAGLAALLVSAGFTLIARADRADPAAPPESD